MGVATSHLTMAVNGSEPDRYQPDPYQVDARPRAHRYCAHDGAREIRMYMAYSEANAVRLRLLLATWPAWRHVSTVYEIPNGWAWTLCNECPAAESRPAVGA